MSTTAVIGLGSCAWVLLAILVALFVARMARLRDSERPDRTEQGVPAESKSAAGAESSHTRPGWERSKTNPIMPGRRRVVGPRCRRR